MGLQESFNCLVECPSLTLQCPPWFASQSSKEGNQLCYYLHIGIPIRYYQHLRFKYWRVNTQLWFCFSIHVLILVHRQLADVLRWKRKMRIRKEFLNHTWFNTSKTPCWDCPSKRHKKHWIYSSLQETFSWLKINHTHPNCSRKVPRLLYVSRAMTISTQYPFV